MKWTDRERRFFVSCVEELMDQAPVQTMDRFIQHGSTTCFWHCVAVAYMSYRLSLRLRLRCDRRGLIRGAMLHDFFLYDWHEKRGGHPLHGFTHPRTALRNAERCLPLNPVEREVILRHMWPLTPCPPRRREALLVCLADKLCSLRETLRPAENLPGEPVRRLLALSSRRV